MEHKAGSRRYDLDWLRVIALGLLIFYHIGMFYVTWNFHIKSTHSSSDFESAMKLLNPWRLSLLFLISGMAARFAVDKSRLLPFVLRRSVRLLAPIIFGVLFIVPPQSWLELIEKGETTSSYSNFYLDYISASQQYSIILPTWNHLWYVVYILVYTIALIMLIVLFKLPLIKTVANRLIEQSTKLIAKLLSKQSLSVAILLTLPVFIFYIHHFILRPSYPSTHALIDDWANHFLFFCLFFIGFLVAKSPLFWQTVDRAFKPSIIAAFFLASLACLVWYLESREVASNYLIVTEYISERLRKTAYAWAFIIAALAIAQRNLNKPNKLLSYMNQAIFSWYIIHQTLIILFGYYLTRQGLNMISELLLLITSTFIACYFLHEYVIRRNKYLRPLFGIKVNAKA